jgi:SP family sugar:H+ symporter-like MFS transporter
VAATDALFGGGEGAGRAGGVAVVCFVCAAQFGFGLGWGAVPWVFPAEVFPMRLKERCLAVTVFFQYATNCLLLQLFPVVTAWVGVGGSCLWFAANMLAAAVCVLLWVPETAGVALEDMEALFEGAPGRAGGRAARCGPV